MEDHLLQTGVSEEHFVPGVFNGGWVKLCEKKFAQLEEILKREMAFKEKPSEKSMNTGHEAERREQLAAAAERRLPSSTTSSQSNAGKTFCPQWRRFIEMIKGFEQATATVNSDEGEDGTTEDETHSNAAATEEAKKRAGATGPQGKATSPEEAKIDSMINDLHNEHRIVCNALDTGAFKDEATIEKFTPREPSHIFGGLPHQSSLLIHQRGLDSRGNELKKIQKETREQKVNEKRMNGKAL